MDKFKITKCGKDEDKFIKEFVSDLREADKKEMATFVDNPLLEITESVNASFEAYKVETVGSKPLALFGVTAVPEQKGYLIWCVGTDELRKYRKSFVKISKNVLKKWLTEYKLLFNFVSLENKNAVDWLKWLGAKFEKPFKIKNKDYMYFTLRKIRRQKCVQ